MGKKLLESSIIEVTLLTNSMPIRINSLRSADGSLRTCIDTIDDVVINDYH